MEDSRIIVTPELSKQIAQVICEEIKQSLTDNKPLYDRAKLRQNQYNQITKAMSEGKKPDFPWENAADYFIPLTEWTIDAVWSRSLNILFSQEPYMTAQGVEASDVPKQEGVTDFIDMVFRETIRLYDNTKFHFKQMLILPFSVLKYEPVKEYDTKITKEPAMVFIGPDGKEEYILPDDQDAQVKTAQFIANGYTGGEQQDVWVSQDIPLTEGPKLEYIRFEDYIWAPKAKRGNRLYWEGNRDWFTLNDLILKSNQDKFIKESVEKVKTDVNVGGDNSTQKAISSRAALIESFHWYGRLPFNQSNEIDFEGTDTIEQEVICIVAFKQEELLQIRHWDHRRTPYPERVFLRGEFEETENFEGRSLADKLYMSQKYMNSLYNNIMNNAWIAMQKVFVKKSSLQGDQYEKPTVYPGAMWEEDNTGDIRVLEVGDVKNIGLELQNTMMNFAERVSNISIFQTGTARQAGGNKTLGEVEKTISEGNIGLDKYIQNCHAILRKICQWTIDYYVEDMPLGLERKIRGDKAQPIFPTQENMPMYQQKGISPYWQPEDIDGKFDFIWSGTSLSSSKEWRLAVANDLMDKYLNVPMVSGNLLAVWDILKRGLAARGIKDWESILPPKEAIIKEMQQMQLEAQQRQAQTQTQPQPAKIVQALVSKGMPPDKAMAIVKQKMGATIGQPVQA